MPGDAAVMGACDVEIDNGQALTAKHGKPRRQSLAETGLQVGVGDDVLQGSTCLDPFLSGTARPRARLPDIGDDMKIAGAQPYGEASDLRTGEQGEAFARQYDG